MEPILIVDDDVDLLRALSTGLENSFRVNTAPNTEAALALLRHSPPFAALIADMRMPGANGIDLLKQARRISPTTARLMLTCADDAATAIEAINEGNVFRFLKKPCPLPALNQAIHAAILQQKGVNDLLEAQLQTLRGATDVLVKVIQMVAPETHALAERLRQRMRDLALEMMPSQLWELEVTALLAPLGRLASPGAADHADPVDALMGHFPQAAAALLKQIPRLDAVARAVGYLSKNFDGSGLPADPLAGQDIPLGARMLRIVRDLEAGLTEGLSAAHTLQRMQTAQGVYDPDVLAAAVCCFAEVDDPAHTQLVSIGFMEITEGQILASDIPTSSGILLLTEGCRVTEHLLRNIQRLGSAGQIPAKIPVRLQGPSGAHSLVKYGN